MTNDKNRKNKWRELVETADRVIAPTYGRPNRLFVDGDGALLRDADGQEYLDMSSGIAVLALGHRAPEVAGAVKEAAGNLVHISNLYHSAPPIELARRLTESSFADRVFYCNSGAESVEAAIKFARMAGGEQRREVVYFDGSFHGRTLGSLAATDRPDYQKPFEPLAGGFKKAPWNDDEAIGAVNDKTALVILEPIQGEKGVRSADGDWVRRLRRRCDETGALLCFDEIQCGLGRTGRLWAHESFGVTPDLMTLAKPLAGGLPIGVVLMTEAIATSLKPGCHGTTFGGGPLVTHVATKVFDTVSNPTFLASVREKGGYFKQKLEELAQKDRRLAEIRADGLMMGIRLQNITPKAVVDAALEENMLLVPAGDNVVRLLPPLNISPNQIDTCIERLVRVFAKTKEENS